MLSGLTFITCYFCYIVCNSSKGIYPLTCPKTGLPDFAVIKIEYIPAKWCVELKSFKEYLISYRNVGVFHEHVVNKILEDFVSACGPRWVNVIGEFNVRGGIKTTVRAQYKK